MPSPGQAVDTGDLTVEQAMAARADHARLAAHYADRVEQARAAGQYRSMWHWMHEYRRATMRCRLLGERIRRERNVPEQTAANGAPLLARLAPRPAADTPPAGEAA